MSDIASPPPLRGKLIIEISGSEVGTGLMLGAEPPELRDDPRLAHLLRLVASMIDDEPEETR